MVFRKFSLLLGARLGLVGAGIALGTWLLIEPGMHGATLLVGGIVVLAAAELWWFVSRTNREVSRFLDAARYADYSQRFRLDDLGTGFDELGETFTEILDRIFEVRGDVETEIRRLNALIDHIPVPLMTVHSDNSVTLQNNAARRLFGAAQVTKLSDLQQFGWSFYEAVRESVPGNRELVTFNVDDVEYRLTLAATENIISGESSRLVSLQDIQTELDVTQAEAWQDLVRVLAHEIMNSITPVTSLANTAADLVDDLAAGIGDAGEQARELDDLRDAVRTLARRSDSLMQFVESYRQISRLAPPEKKRVLLADLFDSVRLLAEAEHPECANVLSVVVEPPRLDVYADRDLLEPVLLNLLRNAWQATAETDKAHIELRGRLNRRGNVTIEVADNGPGVPEEIANKIFVPFFTTKEKGSGVGLALARQVMTAHGGFIRMNDAGTGGAVFTMTF